MIIDLNASLGHYPFRRLPHTTAEGLVGLMDRHGIDRAVVTSLHSVFYRDAHQGNEELFAACQAHAGRLIPVATVNPQYPGWERDLAEAIDRWRMKAVALWPEHQGYSLTDAPAQAALAAIAERDVPLMLVQRLEDRRHRHAWDKAEDLAQTALLEVARQHPRLRFLLVNWAGLDGAKLVAAGLKGRCLIDFARLQVVYRKDVPKLIARLGADAIAFGSHLPFDYVASALIKLANLESLPAADCEKIAWRNAAEFLRLSL